jgi:hypothetical protein
LSLVFNPCHGSFPFKKYIKTYPSDSMSSLLDCSVFSFSLTYPLVRVHTGVSRRSCQTFSLFLLYMGFSFMVSVFLG